MKVNNVFQMVQPTEKDVVKSGNDFSRTASKEKTFDKELSKASKVDDGQQKDIVGADDLGAKEELSEKAILSSQEKSNSLEEETLQGNTNNDGKVTFGKDVFLSKEETPVLGEEGRGDSLENVANIIPDVVFEEEPKTEGIENESIEALDVQMAAQMMLAMANTAMVSQPKVTTQSVEQANDNLKGNGTSFGIPSEKKEIAVGALESLLTTDKSMTKQIEQNKKLIEMLANRPVDVRVSDKMQEVTETPVLTQVAGTQPLTNLRKTNDGDTQSSILEGIPLVVEDENIIDTKAQMSGDMLNEQPQQRGSQETSAFEATLGQKVDASLPEAEVIATPQASEIENVQSLNPNIFIDSLQAAKDVNEVQNPNEVRTDYDIPKQIIEQAKLIRADEDTQMLIKLKPEHLGELVLKVSVSAGGTVNASFHSDNAQVRGIIESTMMQLKQELETQGIKIDNIDVKTALSDNFLMDSQTGQQEAYYQQQSGQPVVQIKNEQSDREAFVEGVENLTVDSSNDSTTNVLNADSVDYLV